MKLRVLDLIFCLITYVYFVFKALRDFDFSFDSIAYHLPFAARRAGILTKEQFSFPPHLEEVYNGFPPLVDIAQGLLWSLFGTPNGANLLNLLSIFILLIWVRVFTKIPLTLTLAIFLAIPSTLTQLTSAYVDLWTNVFFLIGLLSGVRVVRSSDSNTNWHFLISTLALVIAANSKPQFPGLSLLFFAIIAGCYLLNTKLPKKILMPICFIIVLMIVANPLRSIIIYSNPAYPYNLKVAGYEFEGVLPPAGTKDPQYLADKPSSVRWLLSVLEYGAYEGRQFSWSIDQGNVAHSSNSFRMGGYFVPFVLLSVLLFFVLGRRFTKDWLIYFLAILLSSLVVSNYFSSSELRYYQFWILFIAFAVSDLVFRESSQKDFQAVWFGMVVICVLSVSFISRFEYLKIKNQKPEHLIKELRIGKKIKTAIKQGDTNLCIINAVPYHLLYSSYFHKYGEYQVRSTYVPDDCQGHKIL